MTATVSKKVLVKATKLALLEGWKRSGMNAFDYAEAVKAGTVVRPSGWGCVSKLSGPTLYRWDQLRRELGEDALAPRHKAGAGPGSKVLTKLDKAMIQDFYLNQNQISLRFALDLIADATEGRRIPYGAALRYVKSLPLAYYTLRRLGNKKYSDKFEVAIERDYELLHSMEKVTSDHHCLDFLVIERDEVFRPWVTVFQDIRSRKILGWVMTRQPSGYTILEALEKTVDEYGVPEHLHLDNGKDYRQALFTGKEIAFPVWEDGLEKERRILIDGLFSELGCEVHYTEVYHGQSKPVERWFKEVAERFSKTFPTYVGSNTTTRPEDAQAYYKTVGELKKKGVEVTFKEALTRFGNFVAQWNATHAHSGDGMNGQTPDVVFAANWRLKRILPPEKKELVFVRTFTPTVGKNGITIDGESYDADELIVVKGQKVIAKRPLSNVTKVFVHTLDGLFLCTAYCGVHSDTGLPEMNVEKTKRMRKAQKAIMRSYDEMHPDYKPAGISAIAETARRFKAIPDLPPPPEDQVVIQVAGGVAIPIDNRPTFSLVKGDSPNKPEKALIGLLE